MIVQRATYLVGIEFMFLLGVALGQAVPVAEPLRNTTLQWIAVSLIALAFHFNDRRLVMWLALASLALVAGVFWQNLLGEATAWQLPHFRVFEFLARARSEFVRFFATSLPVPYGNLVASIVLGGKGLLTSELRQNFIATGTLHLVAVSGYNVTIVLKIFVDWLKLFSPIARFLVGSVIIVAFSALVGGQASVVRAAILAWLLLVAQLTGRQGSALPALVFAATIMVIHKPSILLHDVGFQLSFLAFLGLVYIAPLLKQAIGRLPIISRSSATVGIMSETLGAQVAVLPILLFHFGQLTPLSPIANFLILPIVPILTIAALVIGILGSLAGPTLLPLAYPLYPIAWYIVHLTGYLATLPGSGTTIDDWPWWLTVTAYLAMFLIVSHFWKAKNNLPN
ncbi:ComEC/Rec2 family competence protein [Candidatus Berkelbacteria bacterium]|nr:ComEC/Rec2 family competence protein [Candidatus Berkelbacteria bacterium]